MISSTTHQAVRLHGVCSGSIWRQEGPNVTTTHQSGDLEYANAYGNYLNTYESLVAFQRGDAPIRCYEVVGASSTAEKGFRCVTNQGTHVTCQTVSQKCRDLWLATLNAGLELSLLQQQPKEGKPFEMPAPQTTAQTKKRKPSFSKYCQSCGALDSKRPILGTATPLFQYGKESRCDVCHDCLVAQGVVHHLRFVQACMESAKQEQDALQKVWNLCAQLVSPSPPTDVSSKAPAASTTTTTTTTPGSPETEDKSSNSSSESWTHIEPAESSWIYVAPTQASSAAILELLQSPSFASYTRVSAFLERVSDDLINGRIGVPDFIEELDEAVGRKASHSLSALKKQAFRVAGDMGSAMKLLLDNALPKMQTAEDKAYGLTHNVDILKCVLEFMLDLCDESDISAVAFFWPQLCHIHLCMLPGSSSADVARIELVEDFLLTVATRYSIHLALELIWSHTADLEESLAQNQPCSAACRRRRYAILSFVCELESLLFGYEEGWGGGSVCLGKMLVATGHQLELMQGTMKNIQTFRKSEHSYQLNRSARYDVLTGKCTTMEPAERAMEKLRIAKNADYFSGHLNFNKRLADVAEKLRFMDVSKRASALVEELDLLNSSGAMGGDPLNRVRDEHVRVVRVPNTEGHVFRSKERTPVLLLMEILEEGTEDETPLPKSRRSSRDCDVGVPLEVTIDSSEEAEMLNPITPLAVDSGYACAEEESFKAARTELDSDKSSADDEVSPDVSTMEVKSVVEDAEGGTFNVEQKDNHPSTPIAEESDDTPNETSIATPLHIGTDLEGASDETKPTPRIGALKKFGSESADDTPLSPKNEVEMIVSNTLVEKMLTVPELESPLKDKSSGDVGSPKTPEVPVIPRKMLFRSASGEAGDGNKAMAPTGDIRREVLNTIMMKGKKGNSIAAGAADSLQRSLKELERKRATELLLRDDEPGGETETSASETAFADLESTQDKLASLGFAEASSRSFDTETRNMPTEEDEVMEAVRLLLIQNRVAQGQLSPDDAQKVLQHVSLSRVQTEKNEKPQKIHPTDMPIVDAGDLDARLAGCGPLPPAVLQALTLWKGEMVTNGELLELVKKDIEFVRHSVLLEAENVDKLNEDSAFWGRFAFGERWAEKKARIAASSPQGSLPGWDLTGVIVKSNDDLRQEAFVMQLIELCQEAFDMAGLELWVNPYRILATGRTTGIIEMVRNAMSFDALKKRPGYGKGGLREHLHRMTEFTADPGGAFKSARRNFVRSLAAYSLMSYIFLFKDRHNGNILLDTAGHVIHIDFGFVFGIAPGGSFSLELSTPFKLTDEMLEVMGGLRSPLFSEFVTLFCCGFLALQSYCDTFLTLVEITCRNSTFKCFEGRDPEEIVSKLRERFVPDLSKEETIAHALDLIHHATTSYGTRQYDLYQYLSQGIAA
eukprot:scaffold10860_cov182-Amphora_coffeaeformis.AAC.26